MTKAQLQDRIEELESEVDVLRTSLELRNLSLEELKDFAKLIKAGYSVKLALVRVLEGRPEGMLRHNFEAKPNRLVRR